MSKARACQRASQKTCKGTSWCSPSGSLKVQSASGKQSWSHSTQCTRCRRLDLLRDCHIKFLNHRSRSPAKFTRCRRRRRASSPADSSPCSSCSSCSFRRSSRPGSSRCRTCDNEKLFFSGRILQMSVDCHAGAPHQQLQLAKILPHRAPLAALCYVAVEDPNGIRMVRHHGGRQRQVLAWRANSLCCMVVLP